MSFLEEYQHLKLSLEAIIATTNNFGKTNRIGRGGFGTVYQGKLVISEKLTMVAIKRLDSTIGQGAPEFWREIMLLSLYKHENLVSLLGFCDEKGESILVYEFLPKKSLDLYLGSTDLCWSQRLRICIGAAKGLEYIHAPPEGSQLRVLHRDIKSANILLDHNFNAKIADFGLSKLVPANQQFSYLFSAGVGTMGYCDPLYIQIGFLTKESDVYSFGAVLFEVLCGRPCVVKDYKDERRVLPELARKCYLEKKLGTIISTSLEGRISPECLERFSKIAYQCLQLDRKQRPSMTEILKELEIALEYQEQYEDEKHREFVALESKYWGTKLPTNLDAIIEIFKIPYAIYSINKELFSFLHQGILFDEGEQLFWINDDGERCVLISSLRFLPMQIISLTWQSRGDSRFRKVAAIYDYKKSQNIKCHIKTSMLSLGTSYTASLVFKFQSHDPKAVKLTKIKWKTQELSICSTHYAKLTDDNNWYSIKMWHFINDWPHSDFDIVLEELSYPQEHLPVYGLIIQGIEFQPRDLASFPLQMQQYRIEEDMYNDDEEYWDKKLPDEHQRLIRMSEEPLEYTTKKELYLRLCEGFLGHHDKRLLWVVLCKSTCAICSMLRAADVICDSGHTVPLSESRFHEVIKPKGGRYLDLKCRLESPMFSPHCIYACYLVFKFQYNQPGSDDTVLFKASCRLDNVDQGTMSVHMSLDLFGIPTIKPTNDYGSYDSSNIPRKERVPMQRCYTALTHSKIEERKDGWMEVMLCKPLHYLQQHRLLDVKLSENINGILSEIIIEGIEFRPFVL